MAGIASRVRKLIIPICVTGLTSRRGVCARQRESRGAVVEGGGLPGRRRMARLACLAEVA
jgi:hypothetical protein